MSSSGDGLYSQLMEEENRGCEQQSCRFTAGHDAPPVFSVNLSPSRPRGSGPYRLATVCLATLCVVLLVSVIAVTAHYKNKAEGGGDGGGDGVALAQMSMHDADVASLTAAIKSLEEEKLQLQKEKEELLLRLAAMMATKAPKVMTKPTAPPVVCPVDWHLFNNSCYHISRNHRDWGESQSFCQSKGAHLAIIHTAEEQTFLWDLLPRAHWNAFWFGITDGETEDQWKWVDGTQLVGGFWEVGEPNNHINEDCGYIVKTQVLERVAVRSWYDAPCSMALPHICEMEMGVGSSSGTALPH